MTGTFEGVGSLQFTPDNKLAYACSGIIEVTGTSNQITMIEFETTSEYISGEVQFMSVEAGGNDLNFFVYFNDVVVGTQSIGGAKEFYFMGINIIVPPFTKVTLKGINIDATTARDSSVIFTGKVYGAIEQENLEAITNNNKWAKL